MPSPPIQLFLTTIASAPALRQRQEYLLRILQVKKIPFVSYDLASDENAKRLWRRKGPKNNQTLPGILVGGVWPGPFEKFEEAVEHGELDAFLRLKEEWDPELEGKTLRAQPVGVPGAAMPAEMTGHKPSFAPDGPTPMRKSGAPGTGDEVVDAGEVFNGYGLQGVEITINELADLAKELGLDDKKAAELAKGLAPSDLKKDKPSEELEAKDSEQPKDTAEFSKGEDKDEEGETSESKTKTEGSDPSK
ncbi:hypothetical protein CPB86DRAFT_728843 [Serendipita vermifera]|nr:hypothetical protein CPB86DRAFT_728843 [Serendipita vermifera]